MRGTLEQGRAIEFVHCKRSAYRQNIGIAAVTPAYLILEVLNRQELKDFEPIILPLIRQFSRPINHQILHLPGVMGGK